jgi:hypothetical protein
MAFFFLFFSTTYCTACQELDVEHLESLFKPNAELSEIVGFLAGLGTTFAASRFSCHA